MSNRFFPNAGHMYSNSFVPRLITCQFKVDNTQGAGISGLISNGFIKSVFMHSSSPSSANPNPAAGNIQIQLQDNYTKLLSIQASIQSPLSGSPLKVDLADAALTPGVVYTITVLGDATAADWAALGVPSGVTPAVGVSFVALVSGHGVSATSRVQASSVSGITSIEQINNPSLMIPQPPAGPGEYLFLQALGATSSSVTTLIPTAPAAGSIISLSLLFSDSSATVDGL